MADTTAVTATTSLGSSTFGVTSSTSDISTSSSIITTSDPITSETSSIITTSDPTPTTTPITTTPITTTPITTTPITTPTSTVAPLSTTTTTPSNTFTTTTESSVSSSGTTTLTSVLTISSTDGSGETTITRVLTSTTGITTGTPASSGTASSTTSTSSTSSPASLTNDGSNNGSSSSGLSTGGTTAIAVVIPVVVVALLVLAGIFFWRKRKQRKEAEDARRKELHDYGFNPNNDPTLPAVASESGAEMVEDQSSGYRGWGAAGLGGAAAATTIGSNRAPSTTMSNGHTHGQLSDVGSQGYGHESGSPGLIATDGHSGDALVNQRRTMGSDELSALGAAPLAATNGGGLRRGVSNASSAYSNGAHSEASEEPMPSMPSGGIGQAYDYQPNTGGYAYGQHGPYGDGSYGGGQQDGGMPIVRDVSARRNTRIQQGGSYQQANNGIAQNF